MIDEASDTAPATAAEQTRPVRKAVFEIAGDIPGIVNHPIAIGDDRHEMLAAQSADSLDIGEADMAKLGLDAFVRQRVADAPRERARPPSAVADALVHDEAHSALLSRCGFPHCFVAAAD